MQKEKLGSIFPQVTKQKERAAVLHTFYHFIIVWQFFDDVEIIIITAALSFSNLILYYAILQENVLPNSLQ